MLIINKNQLQILFIKVDDKKLDFHKKIIFGLGPLLI
ncbi:hypothetical protein HDEF_2091 [Candidatus Hamiltonella defensa 5AT (Acyrthosiphon pisum)]|uniref:Uncharacterized protein n=1 Tax=Hamiltonella defensa subsp. Acyrthosiphon pisum (strain 5AT) TaxID=572265 RepID=C4K7W4_HAMD5|nr:hypothetical protein HDEF_2091 [Candidatus Hamiltonella defensa 5AT (Acyrthosiphon pisum)]